MSIFDDLGITPRELREANDPGPSNPLEEALAEGRPATFREVIDRGIDATPGLSEGRATQIRTELRAWADAQDERPERRPPRLARRDRPGALAESLGEDGVRDVRGYLREEAEEGRAMSARRGADRERRSAGSSPSPPCWAFPN